MTLRILVVCRQLDLGQMLKEQLEDEFSTSAQQVFIDLERSLQAAQARLQRVTYDLLVTEADIPIDRKTPLNPTELHGLSLAKIATAVKIRTLILAVTTANDFSERSRGLSGCVVIQQQEANWAARTVKHCREIVGFGSGSEEERKGGEAEIVMDLPHRLWTYSLKGIGLPYRKHGELQIDLEVMDEVRELSDLVAHNGGEWECYHRRAGHKLVAQLFKNNYNFNKQFFELVGKAGGPENVRIQFVVEKTVHSLALEALHDEEYWMLKAPIYRRLNVGGDTYPLFSGEGSNQPLNCLIIESDVDGAVPGMTLSDGSRLHLEKLQNIAVEAETLESLLKRLSEGPNDFNIGEIVRIDRNMLNTERQRLHNPELAFWEVVKQQAKTRTWSIVHYAGHSFHHEQKGGVVFFPGEAFPEAITVEVFSHVLKRPRFVYLSSCKSSHASFAFELAGQNVGSILGFRWDIEDLQAASFAKLFYEALFEGSRSSRSLEYAFLEARQEMHARDSSSKIWAAPILMMA